MGRKKGGEGLSQSYERLLKLLGFVEGVQILCANSILFIVVKTADYFLLNTTLK